MMRSSLAGWIPDGVADLLTRSRAAPPPRAAPATPPAPPDVREPEAAPGGDFFALPDAAFPDLRPYLPAGAPVLDLGCARGRHLLALAEQGFRGFGLDRSGDLLESARFAARPLVRAHLLSLPFADRTLGGIVAWQVLCHFPVPDAQQAFTELRRVLRPGGILVLSGCEGAGAWGLGGGGRTVHCPPELLRGFEVAATESLAPMPGWPYPRWLVIARLA